MPEKNKNPAQYEVFFREIFKAQVDVNNLSLLLFLRGNDSFDDCVQLLDHLVYYGLIIKIL